MSDSPLRPSRAVPAASVLSLSLALASGCASPVPSPLARVDRAGAQAQMPAPSAASAPRAQAIPPTLDNYIARPEPAFAWKEDSKRGALSRLSVTSQTWQNKPWTHAVEIARPTRDEVPGAAMIVVNFGSPTPEQTFVAQLAANATGVTIVNAFNVPNQPLYERYEDDLIAYTFAQHLAQDKAESDWPLLLPMTKSATQIMRAVEEWSKPLAGVRPAYAPITKWGVSGASKRGWTAWLVAAAEEKARPGTVLGIVPMVYDNLNLGRQMPHQKASWGAYSEMIADYSKRGLPDIVSTPRGRELAAIIDPWTYRERFSLPKLIINGSNDRYWTLDSLNLYRAGLPGQTNVFYAPNSGHMLDGNEARVAGISATWFKMVAQGKTPPQVLASVVDSQNKPVEALSGEVLEARAGLKWRLQVLGKDNAPVAPRSLKLWSTSSASRDFRSSRWASSTLQALTPGIYEIALSDERLKGESAFHAAFAEIELPGGVGEDAPEGSPMAIRVPFALSSPVTIWK